MNIIILFVEILLKINFLDKFFSWARLPNFIKLKKMMKHEEQFKIGSSTTLDEPVSETIVRIFQIPSIETIFILDCDVKQIDERFETSCC